MSLTSYELDPCTPCMKKYNPCDINNINNCCYNIVAGYVGSAKYPEIIHSTYAKKCEACVKKSAFLNGNSYYWRNFRKPIIYTQIPHYFPDNFKECGNKEIALRECIKQCNTSDHPGECKEYCMLDSEALILNHQHENNEENEFHYQSFPKEKNCTIL